ISAQGPWNTPLQIMAQGCAFALAAGNTLVVKSSADAPRSLLGLGPLSDKAGFPPGVLNFVTGLGPVIGPELTTHPLISKVIFTGSPEAGKIVAAQAAARLVPLVLELGGKSPNIVFDDADLDAAAAGVVGGFT